MSEEKSRQWANPAAPRGALLYASGGAVLGSLGWWLISLLAAHIHIYWS